MDGPPATALLHASRPRSTGACTDGLQPAFADTIRAERRVAAIADTPTTLSCSPASPSSTGHCSNAPGPRGGGFALAKRTECCRRTRSRRVHVTARSLRFPGDTVPTLAPRRAAALPRRGITAIGAMHHFLLRPTACAFPASTDRHTGGRRGASRSFRAALIARWPLHGRRTIARWRWPDDAPASRTTPLPVPPAHHHLLLLLIPGP